MHHVLGVVGGVGSVFTGYCNIPICVTITLIFMFYDISPAHLWLRFPLYS